MVYGELGKHPLSVNIKANMLRFWSRIINGKESKLSYTMYQLLYNLHLSNVYTSDWIKSIKGILIEIGEPNIWFNQSVNSNWLKHTCKHKLRDCYIQKWFESMYNSKSCYNYRLFKSNFTLEKYLICLPTNLRIYMCKFRVTNTNLPVHQHRIDYDNNNVCDLCKNNSPCDEFHYMFECNFFQRERKLLIPKYYWNNPNAFKFHMLFNNTGSKILRNCSKFCKLIINTFCSTTN